MQAAPVLNLFKNYHCIPNSFDELIASNGGIHPEISSVVNLFNELDCQHIRSCQRVANATFKRSGITFTVYSDNQGTEKIFPFDLIPRIISNYEWHKLEQGLCQRLQALNAFLNDIYHEQNIIKANIIPRQLIESASGFLPVVKGIKPPGGVYIHVAGIDVVRGEDGNFLILEDNVRTPSGVSYVIENRFVMKRLFPDIFSETPILPVQEYPLQLLQQLNQLAPVSAQGITVVLTPGSYNSAYFEHCYLARKMGCELVKGEDLFIEQDKVYLKTTRGPQRVSVIYRRIDDDFIDPEVFNPDSLLGVPGLMRAYHAGQVVLANAIGNGVADDKAIYPYVPAMIRFYLGEEPMVEQVPTFSCENQTECAHVLANLKKMVVKAVDASGGYGILIGPEATRPQLKEFADRIKHSPRKYIAQPVVELSTCPTYVGKEIAPRRVDLRPFIITGKSQWVLPGGLTRVALNKGSYVVNSSQGGGSKDTWVLGSDT